MSEINLPELAEVNMYLPDIFFEEAPTLDDVKYFVQCLKEDDGNLGKDPFPIEEYIKDGFYYRTVKIPAGHLLAGAIHRQDSTVLMSYGKLIVAAAGESTTLEGRVMFMSAKGKQKIGYAVKDSLWTDIHPTDATTCEEAYAELFTEDYSVIDRDDYYEMLADMGITDAEVRHISGDMADHVDIEDKYMSRIDIANSDIQGRGVFVLHAYKAGDAIVPVRLGDRRTCAGRYTNHSPNPNVVGELMGDDIYFVAINDIAEGDELTVDYRQARAVALEADKLILRR